MVVGPKRDTILEDEVGQETGEECLPGFRGQSYRRLSIVATLPYESTVFFLAFIPLNNNVGTSAETVDYSLKQRQGRQPAETVHVVRQQYANFSVKIIPDSVQANIDTIAGLRKIVT